MVKNVPGTTKRQGGTGKSGLRLGTFPRFNIGVRFVGLVILVSLLIGAVIGHPLINASRDALRQQVLQNNLSQADLAAEFASNYIAAIQAHVRVFAKRPDVQQAVLNNAPVQLQTTLAQFVEIQTALEGVEIYDTNGMQQVTSSADTTTIGQSFADRDWFPKVITTRQPYLGLPLKSGITGSPVEPYAVPILDERGQIRAVLSASISLGNLSDAVVNIKYASDTRASMIDFRSGGLIIADKDPQLIATPITIKNEALDNLLTGKRGASETINSDKELDLIGFAPVADLPWGVMVITPSVSAFAVVATLSRNAALYTGIIVLLAAIMGVILVLSVTRPLRHLVEGTEEIGKGNLDYKIAIRSRDEIGDLSTAFERMALKLKQTTVSRDELSKEIVDRNKVEDALRQSETLYRSLFENMLNGFAHCKMLYSEGQPQDFTYISVNSAFEALTGLKNVTGKNVSEVIPGIRQTDPKLFELYSRVALSGIPEKIEIYVEALKMWFSIGVYSPQKEYFVAIFDVITERKRAEEELKKTLTELKRSNDELQRFAYVASHDLQEPLRMVASYVQLLERRYKDKLDPEANDFINFAVEGAKRMQNLINDLLTYSRVDSRAKPFQPVNLEEVLSIAVANLEVAMKESGAEVTYEPLPTVMADEGQMIQVFQNLLSNAFKFHRNELPHIRVSATPKYDEWIVSIADNGIGIEPQYFERIFTIFQRLHREYPGTGAGLSIAKRIIERHGGRIWVESQPGEGSIFYFSLSQKGEKQK